MATIEELRKLAAEILKEANEGPVHRRLREQLEHLADLLDIERSFTQLEGNFPDVLRVTRTKPLIAFVGDAKDASNQRLVDSAEQISNYYASMKALIARGVVKNALFVIATDDAGAAREWVTGLATLASEAGLRRTHDASLIVHDEETFFAVQIVG